MNEHPQNPGPASSELLDLLWELHEGTLTADRAERLSAMLGSDENHRRTYVAFMDIVAALEWDYANGDDRPNSKSLESHPPVVPASVGAPPIETADLEFPSAVPSSIPPERSGFSPSGLFRSVGWMPLLGGTAIVGLLLALGIVTFLARSASHNSKVNSQAVVEVARLESNRDCVWSGSRSAIAEGSPLYSGERIELVQGSAKLRFASGATVVIEAPSSIELATALALRLNRGTVAVRADGPVKDFVVTSPEASIIDLGTSFGVHYEENRPTEIEVFEGTVEVVPVHQDEEKKRILDFGASAKVVKHGGMTAVDVAVSEIDRFGDLQELLWEGGGQAGQEDAADGGESIVAEFNDAGTRGAIDTFSGAVPGGGWLTSWFAAGNPVGTVMQNSPLSGKDNPYLRVNFFQSHVRTVARAYGPRNEFDPNQPHLISWKWRFDGTNPTFGDHFDDRVAFYCNPSFRRSSYATNSWLICVNGANETQKFRRQVYPDQWCFFDGLKVNPKDQSWQGYDIKNMVPTGMKFKPGVIYTFAVAVYPKERKYDAAIRDDVETFVRKGLNFRSAKGDPANIVHFCLGTKDETDDSSFSLDSIRIEPLTDGGVESAVQKR